MILGHLISHGYKIKIWQGCGSKRVEIDRSQSIFIFRIRIGIYNVPGPNALH